MGIRIPRFCTFSWTEFYFIWHEIYWMVSGRTKLFWTKIMWCLIFCGGLVYKFNSICSAYTPVSLNSGLTTLEVSFLLFKYVLLWVRCSATTVILSSLLCHPCMNSMWKTVVVLKLRALCIAALCLISSLHIMIMALFPFLHS